MSIVCQQQLSAGVLVDLYTVVKGVVEQELAVYCCNGGRFAAFLDVAVARKGAPDAPEQYLYVKHPMRCPETMYLELTPEAGDILRVRASTDAVNCTVMVLKTVQKD